MLVDADDFVSPDASRDLYFERVRLGLADEVDPRPGATSDYSYRGSASATAWSGPASRSCPSTS